MKKYTSDPCPNYWNLYQGQEFSRPTYGDWSKNKDKMSKGFTAATYTLNSTHRMTESQLKAMKRAYYACITQIDYELGLLFARMIEMNILENTFIIFNSDHGEMIGDHNLGAKTVFLEGSSHVPPILRPHQHNTDGVSFATAREFHGIKIDHMAQITDIMPTVLTAASTPIPEYLDGINLMDLVKTSRQDNRIFIGICDNHQFFVMDNHYKYTTTNFGNHELLFDMCEDPMEQKNLTDSPAFKEIKNKGLH